LLLGLGQVSDPSSGSPCELLDADGEYLALDHGDSLRGSGSRTRVQHQARMASVTG
jgi:hypothetical protein